MKLLDVFNYYFVYFQSIRSAIEQMPNKSYAIHCYLISLDSIYLDVSFKNND